MPVAKLAQGWQVSRSLAGRLRMFGYLILYVHIHKADVQSIHAR
jgi:hypothetical protein